MSTPEPYELYAVRYAHHDRRASENFIGGDPHDGPMPLDYFVWAIVKPSRTFVVDTGFDATMARSASATFLRSPGDGLQAHRHRPEQGRRRDHQPHALRPLRQPHAVPNARFHLQDREMAFCTGRLHVPPGDALPVRCRRRGRDGAPGVQPGTSVPRWRRMSSRRG